MARLGPEHVAHINTQQEREAGEPAALGLLHAKPHAPLGDVLIQLGQELGHLSGRLGHIEYLIGPPIVEAARRDPRFLHQIQDLDHVRQKILVLADFLAGLAKVAPEQCRIDAGAAARGLPLADLAARLSLSENSADADAAERGELDLF